MGKEAWADGNRAQMLKYRGKAMVDDDTLLGNLPYIWYRTYPRRDCLMYPESLLVS